MRTGSSCSRSAGPGGCRLVRPSAVRGFTYLWLLFAVALTAAGLAGVGQSWRTAAHRERERELIFRGREIAAAIGTYRTLSVDGGDSAGPTLLAELVADGRGPQTVYHLRRLYADPFTGLPDWVLIMDPGNRIVGLRSRSNELAFITADIEASGQVGPIRISDRIFTVPGHASSVATPAVKVPSSPSTR